MHWRLLADNMLHESVFRGVQTNVVLGQYLHNRPQLQPPLVLRNTVSEGKRYGREFVDRHELVRVANLGMTCIQWHIIMEDSYSKSVSSFNSARGCNTSPLFLMPNTHAVSGVLAKIRPVKTVKREEVLVNDK